jgi:hypothetical protein
MPSASVDSARPRKATTVQSAPRQARSTAVSRRRGGAEEHLRQGEGDCRLERIPHGCLRRVRLECCKRSDHAFGISRLPGPQEVEISGELGGAVKDPCYLPDHERRGVVVSERPEDRQRIEPGSVIAGDRSGFPSSSSWATPVAGRPRIKSAIRATASRRRRPGRRVHTSTLSHEAGGAARARARPSGSSPPWVSPRRLIRTDQVGSKFIRSIGSTPA